MKAFYPSRRATPQGGVLPFAGGSGVWGAKPQSYLYSTGRHQLSTLSIETAYRSATRATERSRWQIIWLKKKGKSIPEIMDATGYSRWTISRLIGKYNCSGAEALIDQRRFNGLDLYLSDEQQEILREVIKNNPDNQWTSEKVRIYILEEFKIEMTEVCAWGYLKRLGFSFQQPRPKNLNSATDDEKADFIKKSLWR